MSEQTLMEKNIIDLMDRVKQLEGGDQMKELLEEVAGLDKASAYSVITVNSLVNLLIEKKIVEDKEVEAAIAKEQTRLGRALSQAQPNKEDSPSETKQGADTDDKKD